MKRKPFSVEQIITVLHQAESGAPMGSLCRQVGISEQSFFRWQKIYGSLQPSEDRELKQPGARPLHSYSLQRRAREPRPNSWG